MKRSLSFFLGLLLSAPGPAAACGGCFHPPEPEVSVVTGHRMAFAVSEERTVLWDQFAYSGSPEDFSWVLPIRPGAYLEESRDAWFEALEASTQTQIRAPALNCAVDDGSGSGCACGGSDEEKAISGGGSNDDFGGVTVVHEGTVGPYDTVTLSSEDGDALTAWLLDNGYAVPPEIEPVIEAYVEEGADFIALKLSPGEGVQQMTPVRVVTPGGEYLLPLRMVAAGTGLSVEIVLYVIGEGRYRMPDLAEVFVRPENVTWDFLTSTSDYDEQRTRALRLNSGFSYLTTFADQGAFSKSYPESLFYAGGTYTDNLTDLYFAQARTNDFTQDLCPQVKGRTSLDSLVSEDDAVASFGCGEATDIAAAMIGMHPARVWLTRLELELPREALGTDCVVEPNDSQRTVSRTLVPARTRNRPSTCTQPVFESRFSKSSPTPLVGLSLFGLSLWLFRRRGRPSRGRA